MRFTIRFLSALFLFAALVALVPAALGGKKKGTFVYVHDDGSPQRVYGFEMAKDGTLTELTGSPFVATANGNGCGGYCQTLAYSKKRKMLFHGSANGLTVWSVSKDGELSEVEGSPFALGNDLWGTEVIEQGKRVYVVGADIDNAQTRVYEIAKDGTPTETEASPFAAGNNALGVAVTKKTVIIANQSSDPLSSYVIGRRGALSAAPENTGSNPDGAWTVDVDPKGKFAFTGDGDAIQPHRIDKKTGSVLPIADSNFVAGVGGSVNGIVFSKKKTYPAFVFGFDLDGTNDVRPVRLNKDGTLTPLGDEPVSTGIEDIGGISYGPRGKILIVAGYAGDEIATFTVDPKTGALTEIDSATLTGPPSPDDVTDVQIVQR